MYVFNENYFSSIDSEDKAYLLGFICTDGNIYKRDGHQTQLQISLKDCDDEILIHFKNSLNANHPIKTIQDVRRKNTKMSTITFVSETLAKDLQKIGVFPNKTFSIDYTYIFNLIDKKLWNSLLLGMFDGDGNINYPKDGTISRSHVRLSGPIKQLEQILEILQQLGITTKIIEDKRKYTEPFGSLECTNTISKYCLLKLLYSSKVESLTRKKQNAAEIIFRIENNTTNRKENKDAIKKWLSMEKVSEWHE